MSESSPERGHNSFFATVVTTQEQMMHVIAVRSICFMEETGLKARQTYDGNDYQCTHVIMYFDDEPIASCRIRWFRDFAKIERTALRVAYRKTSALKILGAYVFDHIARKGFDKVTTAASPIVARLWRNLFGFRPCTDKEPLVFHGHEEKYVELVKYLDVPDNAINMSLPANVLMRVEGNWDTPSEFE